MKIGERNIMAGGGPYIIAELGVNHDGSVERALALTDAAARAGADAVKLQLFRTDLLLSRAAKLASYQKKAGEVDPVSMLRRLELTLDDMARVVDLAHALRIHAIVSVFSVELVADAEKLPWDAYKSASPDIINRPLLEAMAATGRPMLISTGASTLREVGRGLGWLRAARRRIAALQCVSSYPAALSQAELAGVNTIAEIFDGPVGYSDHTDDVRTGAWAVRQGARILEKHLTYDRAAHGPDHAASLTPSGFSAYCEQARACRLAPETPPEALGPGKRVLPAEEDVRRHSRQSLTAVRAMRAGHIITRHDLTIKRPGTGLPPYRLDEMIGLRLVHAVQADTPLTHEAVGERADADAASEAAA